MAFDQFAFYETLYDIEHLLGYLKGNELAYDYLTEARDLSTGTPVEPGNIQYEVYLDWDYRFPCDRAEYRVQPYHTEFPFRVHVDGNEHDGGKAKAEA